MKAFGSFAKSSSGGADTRVIILFNLPNMLVLRWDAMYVGRRNRSFLSAGDGSAAAPQQGIQLGMTFNPGNHLKTSWKFGNVSWRVCMYVCMYMYMSVWVSLTMDTFHPISNHRTHRRRNGRTKGYTIHTHTPWSNQEKPTRRKRRGWGRSQKKETL